MSQSPSISNFELSRVTARSPLSGNRVNAQANRGSSDQSDLADHHYRTAIENFAGTVRLPVGIVGPIQVRGRFANGAYQLPLATTEAALVASYHRGCSLISEAGGCDVALTADRISRAPGFVFDNLADAFAFSQWIETRLPTLQRVAASTTSYGKLVSLQPNIEGRNVYLQLGFTTGDAAGQNMVTFATEAICLFIESHSPVQPKRWYIESNHSGDKKACGQSLASVRGKRVTGEVVIPADLLQRRMRVSPEELDKTRRVSPNRPSA
jgi:hydroxymethylglutaryl-CoA reductase (NADPH)